jgi:PhnB protein
MSLQALNAYLTFPGTCRQAFEFYERALGAKVEFIQTFGQSPMAGSVPPAHADKVMHAHIKINGQSVMGSDAPPEYPVEPMAGFNLSLGYSDASEAHKAFAALSEGGKIIMPIDKTFWAEAFGMLTDQFGVPWMINCEKAA